MPTILREAQLARLTTSDLNKRIENLNSLRHNHTVKLNMYEPYINRIVEDKKKIKLFTVYSDQSIMDLGYRTDPLIWAMKVPKINSEKFCKMADHDESLKDIMKHKKRYTNAVKCVDRHMADYNNELAKRV